LDPVWEHALFLLLWPTCFVYCVARVLRQTHGEAGLRAKAGFVRPMIARLAAGPAGLVTGTTGERLTVLSAEDDVEVPDGSVPELPFDSMCAVGLSAVPRNTSLSNITASSLAVD
jgi:hypothetical protein